jgi:hypothetical protein
VAAQRKPQPVKSDRTAQGKLGTPRYRKGIRDRGLQSATHAFITRGGLDEDRRQADHSIIPYRSYYFSTRWSWGPSPGTPLLTASCRASMDFFRLMSE